MKEPINFEELTSRDTEMFEAGAECIRGYIVFCHNNYIRDINIYSLSQFYSDLMKFCMYGGGIPNTENLSFDGYMAKYYPNL